MFAHRATRCLLRPAIALAAAALLLAASGPAAADTLKIGGSGTGLGTMRLMGEAFTAKNADLQVAIVPSLGSSGAVKAVAVGAIDLAVISRPLRDSERAAGITETEYGRTPFVFAVSAKSRVAAITRKELADIYAGRTAKWPDGSPVRIVLRPASDIDSDMVKSVSPEIGLALAAAESRPGVQFSVTDQDAASDLERIPGAIGPSSLALILAEKRALKPLKIDGKDPTPANAAGGTYPYVKRLFFVTAAKRSAAAERFIAFALSPAGRKILTGHGHWIP